MKAEREQPLLVERFPVYTTSTGWIRCREWESETIAYDFTHLTLEVATDRDSHLRRAHLKRHRYWAYAPHRARCQPGVRGRARPSRRSRACPTAMRDGPMSGRTPTPSWAISVAAVNRAPSRRGPATTSRTASSSRARSSCGRSMLASSTATAWGVNEVLAVVLLAPKTGSASVNTVSDAHARFLPNRTPAYIIPVRPESLGEPRSPSPWAWDQQGAASLPPQPNHDLASPACVW